jgi:nitrite reductase/ring-hydroxylating ferredoxin subunit
MDRSTFIKAGCFACTSVSFLGTVLQSCTSVKYTTGKMNENGLLVDLKEFKTKKGVRSYVIVRHEDLQYPVCVYRVEENKYNALLMRCTHQGAELQVSGDQLTCPAHGSSFDKSGKVTQAPASTDLRSFPVTIVNEQLFIDLRKQS